MLKTSEQSKGQRNIVTIHEEKSVKQFYKSFGFLERKYVENQKKI